VANRAVCAGRREIVDWHDAGPSRQVVEPELDAVMDRLVAAYAVGS